MEKRDKWDDAIRTKAECFDPEPAPEDWEAVAARLHGKRKTVLPAFWRYAAAIAVLAVLSAGGYYFFSRRAIPDGSVPLIAKSSPKDEPKNESKGEAKNILPPPAVPKPAAVPPPVAIEEWTADTEVTPVSGEAPVAALPDMRKDPPPAENAEENAGNRPDNIVLPVDEPVLADAAPPIRRKRWSFGAGGGSMSVGNTGAGAHLVYPMESDMGSLNADFGHVLALSEVREFTEIKQNVSHRRPISFGIGAGYALNDRWTLQSGISYSLLVSRWDVLSIYSGEATQRLHFAGIPLGLGYKIGEWKRFRFYASFGGTAEWNIGGNIHTKYYDNSGLFVRTNTETVRMKETQFSVNGRAGVNYPLLHFMNAYIEGGADYYFKTKSSIETVRTDNPFQLSLQAGIRFGF
ncbi:MAG: PorT family protein [Tannerella sp.]|nr:PorT family protein [Tannerella sp.]